jgi:hypothetical protein
MSYTMESKVATRVLANMERSKAESQESKVFDILSAINFVDVKDVNPNLLLSAALAHVVEEAEETDFKGFQGLNIRIHRGTHTEALKMLYSEKGVEAIRGYFIPFEKQYLKKFGSSMRWNSVWNQITKGAPIDSEEVFIKDMGVLYTYIRPKAERDLKTFGETIQDTKIPRLLKGILLDLGVAIPPYFNDIIHFDKTFGGGVDKIYINEVLWFYKPVFSVRFHAKIKTEQRTDETYLLEKANLTQPKYLHKSFQNDHTLLTHALWYRVASTPPINEIAQSFLSTWFSDNLPAFVKRLKIDNSAIKKSSALKSFMGALVKPLKKDGDRYTLDKDEFEKVLKRNLPKLVQKAWGKMGMDKAAGKFNYDMRLEKVLIEDAWTTLNDFNSRYPMDPLDPKYGVLSYVAIVFMIQSFLRKEDQLSPGFFQKQLRQS